MKQKIIPFIAILAIALSACRKEVPSGRVTNHEKSFNSFTSLEVGDAFQVFVDFSSSEHLVRIEADDNIHRYINVNKKGNAVKIDLDNNVNLRGSATLNAYVSANYISNYDISGATSVELLQKQEGSKVNINLSGASSFMGEIDVDELNVNLSGASNADLKGNSPSTFADLSGASKLKDYDLTIENLNIELSGASSADLTVQNEISIDASGASRLNYKGNASITNIDLSGDSKLNKKN